MYEGAQPLEEDIFLELTPVQQENTLKHAKNLSNYFLECFENKAPYLLDIAPAFQYMLVDDEPVLFDLDMYVETNSVGGFAPERLAGILCAVGHDFSELLTEEQGQELADYLEQAVKSYGPELSILSTEPGTLFDYQKWEEYTL